MDLILLGAPGAGKGTLAADLKTKTAIKHISTGDLLREVVASGSALGQELNTYIKSGGLVPDALIGEMIKEAIAGPDGAKGAMLDGFPRTIAQAELLEKVLASLGRKIDQVFYLSVDLDRVIKRLTNRISCKKCGKPYNKLNCKPAAEGVCDVCGGELMQREDDKEETIRKRYNTFLEKTQPLIDYYKQKGLLLELAATDDPSAITKLALEHLQIK